MAHCPHAALVALAATPVIVLFVHALFSRRLGRSLPPQGVAFLSAACAALPAASLARTGGLESAGDWAYFALVYFSLAYAYLHLFNLSETARRLRILFTLERRGETSVAELEETYGPREVLHVRLKRLEGMGSAHKANGRWFLRHRWLAWVAALVALWRRALFGRG